MNKKENNVAFVDGQNLHLGTIDAGWMCDFKKLRIYMSDKYNVTQAYFFIGAYMEEYQKLYQKIASAGYQVVHRLHRDELQSNKKGNSDCDIVFEIMKTLKETDQSIVLVSGDGDYVKTVLYAIEEDQCKKILFPNKKRASSLYKMVDHRLMTDLNQPGTRDRLEKI